MENVSDHVVTTTAAVLPMKTKEEVEFNQLKIFKCVHFELEFLK